MRGLKHQNGCLQVAVGIEKRSGLTYFDPENVIQVSFVPVDIDLNPVKELPWLAFNMKKTTVPPGNLFEDWYTALNLRRPLIPIVEDWSVFYLTMRKILGPSVPINKYFCSEKRIDLTAIRYYLMDMSAYYGVETPFIVDSSIAGMERTFKIKGFKRVNSYSDTIRLLGVYKAIQKYFKIDMPSRHDII